MSDSICTRKLFESKGLPSPCRCPNCEKLRRAREKTGTPPSEDESKTDNG